MQVYVKFVHRKHNPNMYMPGKQIQYMFKLILFPLKLKYSDDDELPHNAKRYQLQPYREHGSS